MTGMFAIKIVTIRKISMGQNPPNKNLSQSLLATKLLVAVGVVVVVEAGTAATAVEAKGKVQQSLLLPHCSRRLCRRGYGSR